MMTALSWNRYGKSRVRLVKVRRGAGVHDLVDLTLDIALEGAFERVYVDGDNSACLATDTMKNTAYAFARQDPIDHVETFVSRLAEHFSTKPGVSLVRVEAAEHPWVRLTAGGRPHPHAFARAGSEEWTTVVTRDASGTSVASGLRGLVAAKTTDSAFAGFPRDQYTTLPETRDRILATSITAVWRYAPGFSDFGQRSVQQTLYAMAEAALAACAGIVDIQLSLPNRHHLLVNLEPFGLDNPNEIFVATEEPFGLIEARVSRT
jgi:urate oxidase